MTTERQPGELRVLLVDDYWVNQKVATRMLQKLGIDPRVAENGREAVEAVQREAFDIVFMDLQMPVMDGIEATAAIRALNDALADLPIIAMTASSNDSDRRRCLDAGMDDCLVKPIRLADIEKALERLS